MSLRDYLRRVTYRGRVKAQRVLCRFGWHLGGNMPFGDEQQFCRCLWCDREFQLIGGEWRDYIRPPRPVVSLPQRVHGDG